MKTSNFIVEGDFPGMPTTFGRVFCHLCQFQREFGRINLGWCRWVRIIATNFPHVSAVCLPILPWVDMTSMGFSFDTRSSFGLYFHPMMMNDISVLMVNRCQKNTLGPPSGTLQSFVHSRPSLQHLWITIVIWCCTQGSWNWTEHRPFPSRHHRVSGWPPTLVHLTLSPAKGSWEPLLVELLQSSTVPSLVLQRGPWAGRHVRSMAQEWAWTIVSLVGFNH